MNEFINYFSQNFSTIFGLFIDHIQLTILAIIISILIGVPLGIIITYFKPSKKPVMAIANIIQAIPSMALLGFMIPLLGIGTKPAIVMVILYSLLPIIKNTVAGLDSINSDTLEAAKGIGLTPMQVLYKVQIPLAAPVIMAGVRISAVSSVGLMTLAAFIGAGGLGYLVYAGIRTVNNAQILAGAIPACILALLIDYIFSILEVLVTPKCNQLASPQSKGKKLIDKIVIIATCICLAGSFVYTNLGKTSDKITINIGSMDFSEQEILNYMLKYLIEKNTDVEVNQSLSLGSSSIVLDAMKTGDVDMYVDYTGTLYGDILKMESNSDAKEVYQVAKEKIKEKYDLTLLDQTPFNDTYTFTVRKDTAKKYNLKTVSDLEKVSDRLVITPTLAFNNRKEALPGIKSKYPNMRFKDNIAMDGATRYVALANKESDVIDAYSTDGLISYYDLVVLEDDKQYFLPYYGVPMVSEHLLEEYPDAIPVINELSAHLSSEGMRKLNYEVDVKKREPAEVAHEFLVQEGLLQA